MSEDPKRGDPVVEFSGPIPGRPAAKDPNRNRNGKFKKGHSGNPLGKGRGKNFATTLREAFQRSAPNKARELAANRVGMAVADIPEEVETIEELMAWTAGMMAVQGNSDFCKEFGDRAYPKPKRVEVSGPGGGPVRQAVITGDKAAEATAGQDYYGQLEGDPDDEDL